MGVAVITGAGRGLGKATAARLARDGHEVVALDLDAAAAEATAAAVGGSWHQCDVADWGSVEAVAARIERCDILVNNAGIWRFHTLLDTTPDDLQSVIAVNIIGVVQCSRAFAPKMIAAGGGSIVNLSSGAAWTNSPGVGVYPATKAAVISLTKQMALEWGPFGIRANAVAPGLIDAGMSEPIYADPEIRRLRSERVPMGRLGTGEDVASVVLFLLSAEASYVNGTELLVDGGVTASVISTLPRPRSVDSVGPGVHAPPADDQ